MTMQEIEQILMGHYHRGAKQDKILQMWNLIGQNYTIATADYNIRYIIIGDQIYHQIIQKVGKAVLNLSIYNNTLYHTQIISQNDWNKIQIKQKAKSQKKREAKKEEVPYGIYCIKYKNEIVYIGMTQTSFEQRWKEHKQLFKNPANTDMLLYHSNLNSDELEFCIMVDLTKEKADRELTTRDIKAMEMGLIACFKPRFNVSGVKIPYRFD